MAKVITFSRNFQSNHPRKGNPTYFVEKFWNAFFVDALGERFFIPFEEELLELNKGLPYSIYSEFKDSLILGTSQQVLPKLHTIRSGKRFKAGDMFSPRVWSGKPYSSKQIIIGPDTEIKKVFDIEIDENGLISINGWNLSQSERLILAENDGLSYEDFVDWIIKPSFNKVFSGQIICWIDNLTY